MHSAPTKFEFSFLAINLVVRCDQRLTFQVPRNFNTRTLAMKRLATIAALLITTALPLASAASAAPQSPDRVTSHCASGASEFTSGYASYDVCR
jgi:hypothetical protein